MLKAAKAKLEALDEFTVEKVHDELMALAQELEVKIGLLLWPLRIAISGTMVTPGGAIEIAVLLGKEECLRRIDKGLEMLGANN